MSRNQFLEKLIGQIESKRKVSINEFNKTDLSIESSLTELNEWYSSLLDSISQTPPQNFVKSILVTENVAGKIQKIEYEYYKKGETIAVTVMLCVSQGGGAIL